LGNIVPVFVHIKGASVYNLCALKSSLLQVEKYGSRNTEFINELRKKTRVSMHGINYQQAFGK
jgi:hypothetical protein